MGIIEWAMKTPENLMIFLGVLIPLCVAVGGLIKWVYDLKVSKTVQLKSENVTLKEKISRLELEVNDLKGIINKYQEKENIEAQLIKSTIKDALWWNIKQVHICPKCWYGDKRVSIVSDPHNTGYYKCKECDSEGIFDAEVIRERKQSTQAMWAALSSNE